MANPTFCELVVSLRIAMRDPRTGAAEGATPRYTEVEKKDAINQAIRDAFPHFRVECIDESITLAEDDFDYTLSSLTGLMRAQDVNEVWLQQETTEPWVRKYDGWHVRSDAGVLCLYVDEVWDDAKCLRVVYDSAPAQLSADADATPVPQRFVLARARFYLHTSAADAASKSDTEFHMAQATNWYKISEEILNSPEMNPITGGEGRVQGSTWK